MTAPELTITRVFDAPPARVFDAWTDAGKALAWMGPRDYPAVVYENDFAEGGTWRALLRGTETAEHAGGELWQGGRNIAVVPDEKLVFTFGWEEPDAVETTVTVTFTVDNGGTRMVFHQAPFASEASRDSHRDGWDDSFDRLAEFLEGEDA